jgi:RNA polymerase sigma-70 factor (ECF subfamily)
MHEATLPTTDVPSAGDDPTRDGLRTDRHGACAPQPVEDAGDARLVEQARDGDDRAFAALVSRYERPLIRVLARLVRDEELARDLAQETFWKVYNRLDRFDTSRRFGPWLFRIGVNLTLDALRRHELPTPASIDRSADDGRRAFDLPDPDPRAQAELVQEVQFVLEKVPIAYRTILVLRDLEGFSSAEVAAIVGRREATVRWRLAKARDLFRQHWERRHDLMKTRREAQDD